MNTWRELAASLTLGAMTATANAATFSIRITDAAGEGLNDTTSFTPVGGNTATTRGQARMNVLLEAARIWGSLLQSNVPIQVDVAFDALTCSASSGTLGAAGPRSVYRNFGGGVSPNVYYVSALADALAGSNQSSSASSADISATFNSAVDSDAACLGGRGFYYGFDHNRGTKVDLLLVVLHEFGHGLGFTSQVSLSTGAGFTGGDGVERFDSYTHRIFDEQFNNTWPALTAAQRVTSATNTGALAWSGTSVNAQAGRFTAGVTSPGRVRLYAPSTLSSGSSVSHFDSALTPSVLMEPNLPSSITTSSTDITVCALQDIGWTVSVCPHDDSNRPPAATAQTVTTTEDTPIVITLAGTDADNNTLAYAIASSPLHGSLSAISPSHTATYTPTENSNGTDTFTFTVNDGAVTSLPVTITVVVAAVNDAPAAQNVSLTAVSGQSASVVLSATDVEGSTLSYSIVNAPQHGTLSGTGANLTYQSTSGYVGSDTFTYRANDGTVNSANATVTIAVQSPPQSAAAGFTGTGDGGGGAVVPSWLVAMLLLGICRRLREASR